MLQLSALTKIYSGSAKVLDHIDLEVRRSDFLYLLGGSGAGKSTLLRILAMEDDASSGKISLFGRELRAASGNELQAIRRSIGYIPQEIRLIGDLSVAENVALSLSLAHQKVWGAEARKRVDEILEKVGLSAKKKILASQISGGEAQRVAVARALVRRPELIIADEPTGAQDAHHTWAIMDLFLRANLSGASVVVATHDREILRRVRKRSAILVQGRIQMEEQLCLY